MSDAPPTDPFALSRNPDGASVSSRPSSQSSSRAPSSSNLSLACQELKQLASTHFHVTGDFQRARECCEMVLRSLTGGPGASRRALDAETSRAMHELGVVCNAQDDLDSALKYCQAALEVARTVTEEGSEERDVLTHGPLHTIGSILAARGDDNSAEPFLRHARQIWMDRRRRRPPADPDFRDRDAPEVSPSRPTRRTTRPTCTKVRLVPITSALTTCTTALLAGRRAEPNHDDLRYVLSAERAEAGGDVHVDGAVVADAAVPASEQHRVLRLLEADHAGVLGVHCELRVFVDVDERTVDLRRRVGARGRLGRLHLRCRLGLGRRSLPERALHVLAVGAAVGAPVSARAADPGRRAGQLAGSALETSTHHPVRAPSAPCAAPELEQTQHSSWPARSRSNAVPADARMSITNWSERGSFTMRRTGFGSRRIRSCASIRRRPMSICCARRFPKRASTSLAAAARAREDERNERGEPPKAAAAGATPPARRRTARQSCRAARARAWSSAKPMPTSATMRLIIARELHPKRGPRFPQSRAKTGD